LLDALTIRLLSRNFAQLKADAPSEWSFSSLKEDEETDDADWWKTRS
jgi:hypothetical protein